MTDNKQYPSVTECVRLVGGIVHSDGNIFFKNANAFIAASEAMRAAQPHDHGPQATTLEEAARDVGKWLNERPNRPLDLRHVAMLAHLAETAQPDSAAVAGPSDAFEKYVDAWKASFLSDNPFHTVVMREEDKKHILAGLNALGAPTQAAAEPWDGHKFKEVQRGLWRCNCGKQIQETAPPGKLSDGAQYRCRKCGEQNRIEFNYAGIVTRRPDGLERDPRDIESDPRGQLIHDASHPLNAASQPAASQDEDSEATNEWRRLALQFDGHRMLALSHLRLLLSHGEDHKKAAQEFVSAPPLDGEEVLKQRIAALATQPQEAAPASQDALTPADADLLEKAIADFNDCGETDVPDAELQRFAAMGYLECAHYNVLPSARAAIDAARAQQEGK